MRNEHLHEKILNIFLTDKFSTLYLHGHPPLKKSSNIIPSLIKTYSSGSLCLWQWNFPKRFHRISLHVHSQYTLKNKETHTPNTLIRINTNGTILTRITDLPCFWTALTKTKVTKPTTSIKHITSFHTHNLTTYVPETHTHTQTPLIIERLTTKFHSDDTKL